MIKEIAIYSILSLILFSLAFSLISQYFLGLPYGWNIEATDSMVPVLNPGCLVFITPLMGQPHVGEIVAYKPPFCSHYIVHEIIKVLPDGYITKGVHNPTPDPWVVKRSWIKGCVPLILNRPISIPYLGYAITTVNTINGKASLLVSLFIIYGVSETLSRRSLKIRRNTLHTVSYKTVFMGLFILFFLASFVVLSSNTVLTYAQWTSVNASSSLNSREIGTSFRLGVLPSNSLVSLELPVKLRSFPIKLPLAVLFYSNNPNLRLLGPDTISGSSNVTFVVNTGKPGFYTSRVGFLLMPRILPHNIMEPLFATSPLLFISFMSLFISCVLEFIVYLVYKILGRYYIL
ncbi:signal peptidase I [Stygiolobus caldivivus]|uniref:S26 family signal peptidase n=1 Tax=Stygiolobus caldivivus TaxID=2824673 RepID=A0A8D5U616_9CREN|nr:signal peptidase I [Stygiolobus caldivivus]BCU69725.1 S26 family signal peptidase [Stygiolobus caldivivus]